MARTMDNKTVLIVAQHIGYTKIKSIDIEARGKIEKDDKMH